jgi:hypothetical protein
MYNIEQLIIKEDLFMEYDNQDAKLGGGIITICVLHFIGFAITLFIVAGSFLMKDQLTELGVTTSSIIINLIIAIVICVGAILILCKLKLGIILYYVGVLANLITGIVSSGFSIQIMFSALLLPILMGIFLNSKKEIFGFGNK